MPKTLIAQNIARIGGLTLGLDDQGKVNSFQVTCEVNYGSMGMTETLELWDKLSSAQRTQIQTVFNLMKSKLEAIILA